MKLKIVNWTSKNEKYVEIFRMSRFLLHLLMHLWTFFTLTQNHIKKNILLKRLTNQSQHNKIAYKPNPSHK